MLFLYRYIGINITSVQKARDTKTVTVHSVYGNIKYLRPGRLVCQQVDFLNNLAGTLGKRVIVYCINDNKIRLYGG